MQTTARHPIHAQARQAAIVAAQWWAGAAAKAAHKCQTQSHGVAAQAFAEDAAQKATMARRCAISASAQWWAGRAMAAARKAVAQLQASKVENLAACKAPAVLPYQQCQRAANLAHVRTGQALDALRSANAGRIGDMEMANAASVAARAALDAYVSAVHCWAANVPASTPGLDEALAAVAAAASAMHTLEDNCL